MSYHIHPVTGTPALCKAEKGLCPFGSRREHYFSKEAARAAFEEQMQDELLSTHKLDEKASEAVRELFQYHIVRTLDIDVKNLLTRTQEELATATSVVKLNRIAALYFNAANDLDDDDNLAEASDMVGLVADNLREFYRGLRLSVTPPEKLNDEAGYVQDRREALLDALDEEKQRNFNQSLLDSFDSGMYRTSVFEVAIVRDEEAEESLGDFIRRVPDSLIFYGNAKEAKETEAKNFVEKKSLELIESFSVDGVFSSPEKHDKAKGRLPEGFRFLSGGEENNVYIHEESKTVYKIPHAAAVTRDLGVEGLAEDRKRDSLNAVVFNSEAAYKKIDREKLSKDYGAEYLNTYFLSLKDGSGKPVGIIVQPFLSDDRYVNYDVTSEEKFDTQDAGVNDVHGGNVRLDKKTGKLVLFDCLFDLK